MGDYRTEKDGILPESAAAKRRRKRRIALAVLTSSLALAAAALWVQIETTVPAPGFVTSETHAEVRTTVPGIVSEILADTGDTVEQGEILLLLEQRDEQAALDETRSRYHKAKAELILLRAQVEENARLRAERIRMAEMRVRHAAESLERLRELSARGLVSGVAMADQEHQVRLLTVEMDKLHLYDETLAEKEIQVLERDLEVHRKSMATAENRLRSRELLAPIAGQVLRYEFVTGELVRSDSVLMEIFGGQRQILKLRISERHAMRVQPGDRYEAKLGTYRGLRGKIFTGRIESLRNVIQDEGQHSYRAAFCSFDPDHFAVPPGTSAEARIFIGKQPLWRWLTGLH